VTAFAPPHARADRRADAHEESARRALEAAAHAAQSMAQEFAQARADGAWPRPAEPEGLLAATPADEAPDDAAAGKVGEFTPQLIAPGEPEPIAEKAMPTAKLASG